MNDYDENINEYRESLGKARKIIVGLMSRLETEIDITHGDFSKECSYIWGDKENVVSLLTKLTGLLVKVIPLEKQLIDSVKTENKTSNVQRIINSDDKEIIRRFIKNYKIDNN